MFANLKIKIGLKNLTLNLLAASALCLFTQVPSQAAGTLTPVGSPNQPIQIRDHHVSLVINNGFAQVEFSQTYFNPNPTDLEATYSFPVPKSASLSGYSIISGETEIKGEVVAKEVAKQAYEEEKSQGNQAGLGERNSYQDFKFHVAKVAANQETRMRVVYYQPIEIDNGIGRFVYPLEDGGTDEIAKSFWTTNTKVENTFSASIDLRMAVPIDEVRVPGFENQLQVEQAQPDQKKLSLKAINASLNKDLIVYYRLAQNLPGRVELLPYRPDPSKPGTFMMIVTPGVDLKAITAGADYSFVLDVSGSMTDKLATLARGVNQALGNLRPQDRFRVITFSDSAKDISNGWVAATPDAVKAMTDKVQTLGPQGGTNLYAGIEMSLENLDADRVSSVVLVTDGVTNTGIIDPKEFKKLLKTKDVRFFSFLMGNSANWPLLELVAQESGGFYSAVSNSDDILGQIMLAKSKIASEALHNVTLSMNGVKTFDTTELAARKIYRGQQLVIFGRYDGHGPTTLTLKAALSGEDKTYTTSIDMPEKDTDYPEIERLWAMNRIEALERKTMLGEMPEGELKTSIKDLGINYQLVTDETSMLVLNDQAYTNRGIDRKNLARTQVEQQAQSYRYTQPVRNNSVDRSAPLFGTGQSHHILSGGGGAIPPIWAILAFTLLGGLGVRAKKKE